MIWTHTSSAQAEDSFCSPSGSLSVVDARSSRNPVLARPRPASRDVRDGIVPNAVMLQTVPLLRALPATQLQYLASRSRIQLFLRGESIVTQGSDAYAWVVLLTGRANLTRAGGNGRAVLLEAMVAGGHHGEMALIDGEPHTASLRCVTQCRVLVVPAEDFRYCLTISPELVQGLTQVLIRRLRQANLRITSLALQDVRDRVMTWLRGTSEPQEDGWLLARSPSRTALANSIGASREMVSRILKNLMHDGTLVARPDGSLLLRHPPPA